MKLEEIANRLDCQIEGDGSIEISGVATLEEASQGDLSFLTNNKYTGEARRTKASAVITSFQCPPLGIALLKHKNPYLTFAKAIEFFYPASKRLALVHPTAWISDKAKIGREVAIGPYSVIEDGVQIGDRVSIGSNCTIHSEAQIADDTLIHSGSVIRERVVIGARCIIQNNAVIGSDGFGYAKQEDGSWYKIYQAGTVVLEDDVEVGACTTIDRATIGETRIRAGAKLDNLVQIGHGSAVGRNSLICAQVGLAGSTKVGNDVLLAGQVGSAGHLTVGDGAIATGQTGIPGDVEPGKIISGSPAIENRNWLKSTAVFAKLPDMQRSVRNLEKRIKTIEQIVNGTSDRSHSQ
jgi:UDP-3-O-[3-hydroxymyristoyl] glucosamine N-acyltransferase